MWVCMLSLLPQLRWVQHVVCDANTLDETYKTADGTGTTSDLETIMGLTLNTHRQNWLLNIRHNWPCEDVIKCSHLTVVSVHQQQIKVLYLLLQDKGCEHLTAFFSLFFCLYTFNIRPGLFFGHCAIFYFVL